ncbi:MAG: hypothetical protein ACSHX5_00195 [Phycisphaerales bacterium]
MKTTPIAVMTTVLAAISMNASAGNITASALNAGDSLAQLNLGDVMLDIQANSGSFASKTLAGYHMMGIQGGHVSGEIDATESMDFFFDQAVRVTSLDLGALFVDGQHGDQVNERAFITINDQHNFELALTAPTAASWNGLGTVTALSQGLQGDAGYFRIEGENIFGMEVLKMTLWAPQEEVSGSRGSDYGFGGLTTATIPAPGAFALVGLGGALCSRRNRA